jgi:hypothetical protein
MKNRRSKFLPGESPKYDRILNRTVPGIAGEGERFKLENGYYTDEKDQILLRSTEITGKFFKKENTEEGFNSRTAKNDTSGKPPTLQASTTIESSPV